MEEPIRILCVDDEENLLKAIQRLFLDHDYEILTATSGNEGLEILRKVSPVQIVISDFRMPGKNGVEFLSEVRKNWPDTIRMIISGYADTVATVSAINEGEIYKFIPKPWDNEELKKTIANSIERYYLQKQNTKVDPAKKNEESSFYRSRNNIGENLKGRNVVSGHPDSKTLFLQNMFEDLPIAALGIDSDGKIIQCNRKGADLLERNGNKILGTNRRQSLPKEINNFIERMAKKDSLFDHFTIDDVEVRVRGALVKQDPERNGIALVFDWRKRTV
jgi:two-component system, NtrC family, sensor kinase